jgi:hypothetical protein
MRNGITKAKARAFKKRWEEVNAIEREEWLRTPLSRKLQELTALAAWGRYFGWSKSPPDRETEVRERWNRLLRAYRG